MLWREKFDGKYLDRLKSFPEFGTLWETMYPGLGFKKIVLNKKKSICICLQKIQIFTPWLLCRYQKECGTSLVAFCWHAASSSASPSSSDLPRNYQWILNSWSSFQLPLFQYQTPCQLEGIVEQEKAAFPPRWTELYCRASNQKQHEVRSRERTQ